MDSMETLDGPREIPAEEQWDAAVDAIRHVVDRVRSNRQQKVVEEKEEGDTPTWQDFVDDNPDDSGQVSSSVPGKPASTPGVVSSSGVSHDGGSCSCAVTILVTAVLVLLLRKVL